MKVINCMTRDIVTVKETTGIREASSILVENKIISIPVVDNQGNIIGIVALSDIIKVFIPDFVPLVDIDFVKDYGTLELTTEDVKEIAFVTVGEIMTKNVFTVDEECSLVRAISMIDKHNVRALPVVRDNKLVGIVSNIDICRRFLEIWEEKN